MKQWNETAHKLLDAAEDSIKVRGYNNFSFRDLQKEVGVKTSTIHYYFPTKATLAEAVMERYFLKYRNSLGRLEKNHQSVTKRLEAIVAFFVANSEKGELCLGGMLISDLHGLSDKAKNILKEFMAFMETWVEDTVNLGRMTGELNQQVPAKFFAQVFVAALEGGMLISRLKGAEGYYDDIMLTLINQIKKREVSA